MSRGFTTFIAPHNDDEILFGTFTILRHCPHVLICFRSERMADPSYPGGMPVTAETREAETTAALACLGYVPSYTFDEKSKHDPHLLWTQWHFSDADPDWEHLRSSIRNLRHSEEHVWVPAIEEKGHEQHNRITEIVREVFEPERVTYYLTYTTEGKSRWGHEVEYEPGWIALKHRALACYASQCAHPAVRAHFLDDIREYVAT